MSRGRIHSGKNWWPIDIHVLCTLTHAAPASNTATPTTTGEVEMPRTSSTAPYVAAPRAAKLRTRSRRRSPPSVNAAATAPAPTRPMITPNPSELSPIRS